MYRCSDFPRNMNGVHDRHAFTESACASKVRVIPSEISRMPRALFRRKYNGVCIVNQMGKAKCRQVNRYRSVIDIPFSFFLILEIIISLFKTDLMIMNSRGYTWSRKE